jgi:hypothetical protein
MHIRRELGAVLAGILSTVLVTAAVKFGRRNGLLQRQPPEEATDQLHASGGMSKVAREQRADPRLHFRWL